MDMTTDSFEIFFPHPGRHGVQFMVHSKRNRNTLEKKYKYEMRTGGREEYPIKIIETAGKTLEQTFGEHRSI